MKEGYVTLDQTLPHFLTATVVDWVDVFSRKNYRDAFNVLNLNPIINYNRYQK